MKKGMISVFLAATLLLGGAIYYDRHAYNLKEEEVTLGVGGSLWMLAWHYVDKQDRYDVDELAFYIAERNGITRDKVYTLRPDKKLIIPLWTRKWQWR